MTTDLQPGDYVRCRYLNGKSVVGYVDIVHVSETLGVTAYRVRGRNGLSQWFSAQNVERIAVRGRKTEAES